MSEWKLGNSNKSSAYLLPLLNQNGKIFFNEFIDDNRYPQRNFVNIFYKCEEYPELRNRLFILYKKDIDNPVYQNFETRLRFFEEFEFEYEPDNVHKMYVFNIDEKYNVIFKLFEQGKYSKFPDYYKDIILKFFKLNPELFIKNSDVNKNKIVGVLFKQRWLKDKIESELLNSESTPKINWVSLPKESELSSIPNEEEETYLNKYKL
jgi:hypothetical protein